MKTFFDTSAIVPLIFREPHSAQARKIWEASTLRTGWEWLRAEAESALCRRRADAAAWTLWRIIEGSVNWVEPEGPWLDALKSFNRGVGLRAADAGHLYLMEQCSAGIPDLVLATFDGDMASAAGRRGLRVMGDF